MNKLSHMAIALLLLAAQSILLATPALTRTRADLMTDAAAYAQTAWTCGATNVSDEMRSLYRPGISYNGVPFALYHRDTPSQFLSKLYSGNIAGCRDLCDVIPAGHPGFAGIDSSGFVSRLIGINDVGSQWQVSDIAGNCVRLEIPSQMRPGDLLVRVNNPQALVYAAQNTGVMSFFQAAIWSYGAGNEVDRVIIDSAAYYASNGSIFIKDNSSAGAFIEHVPYTPFPILSDNFSPQGNISAGASITIKFGVVSRLMIRTATLSINGQPADQKYISIVQSNAGASNWDVYYYPGNALQPGDYTVTATIANEIGLEESKTYYFKVVP